MRIGYLGKDLGLYKTYPVKEKYTLRSGVYNI